MHGGQYYSAQVLAWWQHFVLANQVTSLDILDSSSSVKMRWLGLPLRRGGTIFPSSPVRLCGWKGEAEEGTCRARNVLWSARLRDDDTHIKAVPFLLKTRGGAARFTAGAVAVGCLCLWQESRSFPWEQCRELCSLLWDQHCQICPHRRTCEHELQSHRCHVSLTSALQSTELGRHCNSNCSQKRTGPLVLQLLARSVFLNKESWCSHSCSLCPLLWLYAFWIAAGHISILVCFLCGWTRLVVKIFAFKFLPLVLHYYS